MPESEKARETRLRRLARREGYAVRKARFRNPWLRSFGLYCIVDPDRNLLVAGGYGPNNYGLDLDDVEEWLRIPG